MTAPDWLNKVLQPLRKYSISIAFERELDEVKAQIQSHYALEGLRRAKEELETIENYDYTKPSSKIVWQVIADKIAEIDAETKKLTKEKSHE